MANYHRWFPDSRCVFLAPTRPLIAQQHRACYSLMGIPQESMGVMTGQMSKDRRRAMWHSRRLLFMTPQVLNNDLNGGAVSARSIVLCVVDEAHRARGNHAYWFVIVLCFLLLLYLLECVFVCLLSLIQFNFDEFLFRFYSISWR